MNMTNAALIALYIPITLLAAVAAYLYTTGVITPAIKRRVLNLREHGLAIAIVLGLFSDTIESAYYAVIRIINAYHTRPMFETLPNASIKLTILATSVISLATYYRIVDGNSKLITFVLLAAFLWLMSFTALITIGMLWM